MQHQDKMKFSLPCYNFILINICSLLGSLKNSFEVCICNHQQNELMQKFTQSPNISFVMRKDFPFSNLRDVLFCLHQWLEQVFLSLGHLVGHTGSESSDLFLPFTPQNLEVIRCGACSVLQRSLTISAVALQPQIKICGFWKSPSQTKKFQIYYPPWHSSRI